MEKYLFLMGWSSLREKIGGVQMVHELGAAETIENMGARQASKP